MNFINSRLSRDGIKAWAFSGSMLDMFSYDTRYSTSSFLNGIRGRSFILCKLFMILKRLDGELSISTEYSD